MRKKSASIFMITPYKKVITNSVVMLALGIGFAGILLPKIIRQGMRMQLRITPGTMTRGMFEKVPFAINFRIFILNITNPDEVTAGGKPILQELGPYYFEEYKDKYDIVDDDEEDTMEYEYRNTYVYRPDKNGPGLTGDEIVTMPHPLILAMALSVNVDREELVPFVYAAMNGLLHNPTDIFYKGRLWDLLYDGIELDCSSDEFEVTAVCSEFGGGDYNEIRAINETTYNFSLFGNSNGSSIGRFKALRGKKNILDLGRVLEYNGLTEMDAWYEDECNAITGTDGTIFPPFHGKDEGYTIFVPQMCRAMKIEYQEPSSYAGIKTNRFAMSFDVTRYGPQNCYCREGERCPPKGLLDLYPCAGAPIAISLPHFYEADPTLLDKVEGLRPDKEKHQFRLDFYQYAGAPISAMGRGQANFEIVPIEDIPFMKNLQSMYLPMFWFEDGIDLEKDFTNMIKYQLIMGLKIQKFMKYMCTLVGLAGLVFGAVAYYMQMEDNKPTKLNMNSGQSNNTLTNPNVQSIQVISNVDN